MYVCKVAQVANDISCVSSDAVLLERSHEPSLVSSKRCVGKAEKVKSPPGDWNTILKHAFKAFVDRFL